MRSLNFILNLLTYMTYETLSFVGLTDELCQNGYADRDGDRRQITRSSCKLSLLVMVALRSRCEHYIFALISIFLLFSSFFPRLITAVGDWMSAILPHMVWP